MKELYKQLEIDKFWNWKTRNLSIRYHVDQIFRLLVFSRILAPASKKGTFEDQCHLDKDNIAVRILFTASKHFVYSLFFYI